MERHKAQVKRKKSVRGQEEEELRPATQRRDKRKGNEGEELKGTRIREKRIDFRIKKR